MQEDTSITFIRPFFRYTKQQMDLEIQQVAREMYKAFIGMNDDFEDVS